MSEQPPFDSLRSLRAPFDSAHDDSACHSEASVRTEAESNGAEGGIRTPTGLLQLAPEASASAVPPLPQVVRKTEETKLQYI